MTKTSPVSYQSDADTSLGKCISSVGKVQMHLEVKIVGPASGTTVAPNVPGRLFTALSVDVGRRHH